MSVSIEEEIDYQDELKISAETDIDIVYLTADISEEESLKIVQSIVCLYCLKCLK
jgi:hypothetical protein